VLSQTPMLLLKLVALQVHLPTLSFLAQQVVLLRELNRTATLHTPTRPATQHLLASSPCLATGQAHTAPPALALVLALSLHQPLLARQRLHPALEDLLAQSSTTAMRLPLAPR